MATADDFVSRLDCTSAHHEGWSAVPVLAPSLFPAGPPRTQDVVQPSLGNCYLVAALKSILAVPDGAAFLRSVVRDEGDVVVVRLHDRPDPKGPLVPCDVRVRRSIPVDLWRAHKLGVVDAPPILWLMFVEKAYAFLLRPHEPFALETLVGGRPRRALEHLTGVETRTLHGEDDVVVKVIPPELDRLLSVVRSAKGADGRRYRVPVSSDDEAADAPWRAHLGEAIWKRFAGRRSRDVVARWRVLRTSHDAVFATLVGDAVKILRVDDLRAHLEAVRCPAEAVDRITDYVATNGLLPGKRGTGRYTAAQDALFAALREGARAGRPIVASTAPNVGTEEPGRIDDDRPESRVKGLAGGHAYSVTGVREADGLRFVVLKNPWNKYGRAYEPNGKGGLRAMAVEASVPAAGGGHDHEFAVELSDFTKRFRSSHVAAAHPFARRA